jgi:hypothetical protein
VTRYVLLITMVLGLSAPAIAQEQTTSDITFAQFVTILFHMAEDEAEPLLSWAVRNHACGVQNDAR